MDLNARRFLDGYRQGFEAGDVAGIVGLFAYPLLLVSDGEPVSVAAFSNQSAWAEQLERLIGAYRRLGLQRAEVGELRVDELGRRVLVLRVHWRLIDRTGPLYDFDAAYTLADLGEGHRIVAIVHNELPRMRAALAAGEVGQ